MFDSGMDLNGMSDNGFGGGGGVPMDDILRSFMSQQGGRSGGFGGFHHSPYGGFEEEW